MLYFKFYTAGTNDWYVKKVRVLNQEPYVPKISAFKKSVITPNETISTNSTFDEEPSTDLEKQDTNTTTKAGNDGNNT